MTKMTPHFRLIIIGVRQALLTIALGASLAVPPTAHAIIPVTDVAHIAVSSYTSIQQYLNTAQAYISAYNDVLQTARNLTAFDAAAVFLDSEEKTQLMNFIATGKNLQGALRKTEDVYEDLQKAFAISEYKNLDEFLKDFGRRKAHGDKVAKTIYDAATLAEDELKKAHEQHQKIVKEIPMIEGVTDAALATAQSVGVLIQQTQGISQLMSANSRMEGQELQRQYDERAKEEEALIEIREAQKKAINSDKALFGK